MSFLNEATDVCLFDRLIVFEPPTVGQRRGSRLRHHARFQRPSGWLRVTSGGRRQAVLAGSLSCSGSDSGTWLAHCSGHLSISLQKRTSQKSNQTSTTLRRRGSEFAVGCGRVHRPVAAAAFLALVKKKKQTKTMTLLSTAPYTYNPIYIENQVFQGYKIPENERINKHELK